METETKRKTKSESEILKPLWVFVSSFLAFGDHIFFCLVCKGAHDASLLVRNRRKIQNHPFSVPVKQLHAAGSLNLNTVSIKTPEEWSEYLELQEEKKQKEGYFNYYRRLSLKSDVLSKRKGNGKRKRKRDENTQVTKLLFENIQMGRPLQMRENKQLFFNCCDLKMTEDQMKETGRYLVFGSSYPGYKTNYCKGKFILENEFHQAHPSYNSLLSLEKWFEGCKSKLNHLFGFCSIVLDTRSPSDRFLLHFEVRFPLNEYNKLDSTRCEFKLEGNLIDTKLAEKILFNEPRRCDLTVHLQGIRSTRLGINCFMQACEINILSAQDPL